MKVEALIRQAMFHLKPYGIKLLQIQAISAKQQSPSTNNCRQALNSITLKNMSETYGFFFGRNPIRSGKMVCTDF